MTTLIADIGGTSSRFAIAADGRPTSIIHLDDKSFQAPQDLIAAALERLRAPVDAAVLAIAGPVENGAVHMTNRDWVFDGAQIAQRLNLRRVTLLNDFEAVGYALPALHQDDLTTMADGRASGGPKLALGPGTGLGAAVYVPDQQRVLATEAGHMTFGPALPDEFEVFATLQRQVGHVSAEAVLAGPGLPRLYAALSGKIEEETPETVGQHIADGTPYGKATMALFTRLLGRFAGDLALAFRADGGIYLAGGVAHRLKSFVDRAALREAFVAHPPFREWLGRIPIYLIEADEPGLIGCAAVAAR